jgi:hypothetical protein
MGEEIVALHILHIENHKKKGVGIKVNMRLELEMLVGST